MYIHIILLYIILLYVVLYVYAQYVHVLHMCYALCMCWAVVIVAPPSLMCRKVFRRKRWAVVKIQAFFRMMEQRILYLVVSEG